MKKVIIAAISSAVLFCGCQNDAIDSVKTIEASVLESQIVEDKTELDEANKVVWCAGDQFVSWDCSQILTNSTPSTTFTLSSEPGKSSGTFEVDGEYTNDHIAFYPKGKWNPAFKADSFYCQMSDGNDSGVSDGLLYMMGRFDGRNVKFQQLVNVIRLVAPEGKKIKYVKMAHPDYWNSSSPQKGWRKECYYRRATGKIDYNSFLNYEFNDSVGKDVVEFAVFPQGSVKIKIEVRFTDDLGNGTFTKIFDMPDAGHIKTFNVIAKN